MVHLCHTLLLKDIPIKIRGIWDKVHHYPRQMEPKYAINHHARHLPLSYPGFRICIDYNSSTITSHLYKTLSSSLHDQPLIDRITKKAGWTPTIFAYVDWEAHGRAFCRLTTLSRIGTSKLIHGLAHTTHHNNLFYGLTSRCPICSQEDETFQHVLLCMHPDMRQHRTEALGILAEQLSKIHTPPQIMASILHGFQCWSEEVSSSCPRSLVTGSICPSDIMPFMNSFTRLAGFNFVRVELARSGHLLRVDTCPPLMHLFGPLYSSRSCGVSSDRCGAEEMN